MDYASVKKQTYQNDAMEHAEIHIYIGLGE